MSDRPTREPVTAQRGERQLLTQGRRQIGAMRNRDMKNGPGQNPGPMSERSQTTLSRASYVARRP